MPPRMRRRSMRLNKPEEEGTTKNKGKQTRKHVEVSDSSHSDSDSDSPINLNQSDSWECPPSTRKNLIPDAKMISSRRSSLRSAKRFIEMPSVSRCSRPQKTRENSFATDVFQQVVDTAYQAPAGSLQSPSRYLNLVANPSTLTPEMRHEETELVENSVAPDRFTGAIPVIEEACEAERPMPNGLDQMEGPNTLAADCIPLELQPLAEGIQASNNLEERANSNYGKSTSMVGRPSTSFSLNLTEMVNLCDDEDCEVNSAGQSSPMDTDYGYQVKPEFMPILRKILSKHGDIAKNCTVSTMKYRSVLLEMICDIIVELQKKDFSKTKEDGLKDMIALVNEIKNTKVDIEWLQQRLLEILEARKILKESSMLKEAKDCNKKFIENVERKLEECEAEKQALSAKFKSILEEETVCKKTLAKARDDSTRITEVIKHVKSKVRRFVNCSLADGLL